MTSNVSVWISNRLSSRAFNLPRTSQIGTYPTEKWADTDPQCIHRAFRQRLAGPFLDGTPSTDAPTWTLARISQSTLKCANQHRFSDTKISVCASLDDDIDRPVDLL